MHEHHSPPAAAPLLRVRELTVRFHSGDRSFEAVSSIDFEIYPGQIFCLVGESGCGKSLTAKSLLRLLPENAVLSGEVWLAGPDALQQPAENLLTLPAKAMRRLRGHRMAMIFQEPMTALNPVLRVGDQVTEPLRLHLGMNARQAQERCVELFRQVGIPAPESRLHDYPHQLSGGMRQRVMIAMALACEPALLLADEPTTALDVTIQWQILQLIQRLSAERGMGVLLITHDLGVVAQVAHAVGVMYAGRMVESGPVDLVLSSPGHPYTRGLMHSAPSRHGRHLERLPVIPGSVPPPGSLPAGCSFHPRCAEALPVCSRQAPPLCHADPRNLSHSVRCWLHERQNSDGETV